MMNNNHHKEPQSPSILSVEQYSLTMRGKKVVRRIFSFTKGYLRYIRGFEWLKR